MASRKPAAGGGRGAFTYYVVKGNNNTDPISRALASRPGWSALDKDDAKRDGVWNPNFVWKATWTNPLPAPSMFARGHANPAKRQMYNHLRAVEPLCAKDTVFQTMLSYYTAVGEDPYQHIPPTFLIEPRNKEPDSWPGWREFERHFQACATVPGCQNLWLIKPTDLNRGIGIEVVRTLEETRAFLLQKARGAAMGVQPIWVLQKYIENPLLYASRKFDLRVWVLVSDSGDVFMHAPGYVRTSSEAFDLSSTDRFAHLTNYCQQVNAGSFGKFEEGNTLSFADLEGYLTSHILPGLRAKAAAAGLTASSGAGAAAGAAGAGGGAGEGAAAPADAEEAAEDADAEGDEDPGTGATPEAGAAAAGGAGVKAGAAGTGGSGAAPKRGAGGKRRRTGPKALTTGWDKPVWEAADGAELMWGCGSKGLWGQMRASVIDCFEALRGRGGTRSCGFEENGFAKKPPACVRSVPVPAAPAAAAAGAPVAAGTSAAALPPGALTPTASASGGGGKAAGKSPSNPAVTVGVPCGGGVVQGGPGPAASRHRFELLGLDFIVDADMHVYL